MVKYEGFWNTVRKTVVGNLEDRNGNSYQVRLLVDSGATVSLLLLHTLYISRGEWDIGQTPTITLHGINAPSICDLMVKAKFTPSNHLSKEFRTSVGITDNFSVPMKFHIQKGVEVFKTYKHALPEYIQALLKDPSISLADPEQNAPGDDVLYIHGIIGEDQINELEETSISKVGKEGMKVTRSYYGDILHGRSHFIYFPYETTGLELKGKQAFSCDRICQYGMESVPLSSPDDSEREVDFLRNLCE